MKLCKWLNKSSEINEAELRLFAKENLDNLKEDIKTRNKIKL